MNHQMETTEEKPLINKIAQSGLITIDLEKFYPTEEWVEIDLADYLFKGLILKEKEFREKVKNSPWEEMHGKILRVFCSTDAIIPPWAYMMISKHALPGARYIGYGDREAILSAVIKENLEQNLKEEQYSDKRILVKGCSTKQIPRDVYFSITELLLPHCKSLMYGEACSNVPIYKQSVKRSRN